ncbi:MAG: LysM peptidoglycan-binding domain-containing protein, partial [Gammaproteobacteria bacterium]
REGDTLYSIAWRRNIDFRSLARWNGIRPPYVIHPGQLIRLQPLGKAQRKPVMLGKRAGTPHNVGSSSRTKPGLARSNKSGSRSGAQSSHASRPQERSASKHKHRASGPLHWRWPTTGRVVATWKPGDPLHKGVKIAGRAGQPIRAAESGKVVYSGSGLIGYGRLIIIKHNDKYLSAYGHNRRLLVTQGQSVTRGQEIAEMGKSNDGRALLHFEIRRDGKPVNPMRLLPKR